MLSGKRLALIGILLGKLCGSQIAFATCADVRMDRQTDPAHPSPLTGMTAQDQAGVNVCYSISAIEMMWAHQNMRPGSDPSRNHDLFSSSWFTAAIETAADQGRDKIAMGNPCDVSDYVRQHGLCDGSGIERLRTGKQWSQLMQRINNELLPLVPSPLRGRDSNGREYPSLLGQVSPQVTDQALGQVAECMRQDMSTAGFGDDTIPSVATILQSMRRRELAAMYSTLFGPYCRTHRVQVPELPRCRNEGGSGHTLLRRMDSLLSHPNPAPFSIAFCYRGLSTHENPEGIAYAGRPSDRSHAAMRGDCSSHVALVIGSRTDPATGQCEYLIRDSYGGSCNRYHSDFKSRCEGGGNIWLPSSYLSRNMHGIERLP